MCYTIQDETLKKYILEDFLEKIKNLTPIQSSKKIFTPYVKYGKKDFKVLNRTKQLYNEKNHYSKEEIKEQSVLFVALNYPNSIKKIINILTEIDFTNHLNNEVKKEVINALENKDLNDVKKIKNDQRFKTLVIEINKNSNLKNILDKKNDLEREELFIELIDELKKMNHLKQIEFLENKVAKNLDESSYSELLKLKSQLNRD